MRYRKSGSRRRQSVQNPMPSRSRSRPAGGVGAGGFTLRTLQSPGRSTAGSRGASAVREMWGGGSGVSGWLALRRPRRRRSDLEQVEPLLGRQLKGRRHRPGRHRRRAHHRDGRGRCRRCSSPLMSASTRNHARLRRFLRHVPGLVLREALPAAPVALGVRNPVLGVEVPAGAGPTLGPTGRLELQPEGLQPPAPVRRLLPCKRFHWSRSTQPSGFGQCFAQAFSLATFVRRTVSRCSSSGRSSASPSR